MVGYTGCCTKSVLSTTLYRPAQGCCCGITNGDVCIAADIVALRWGQNNACSERLEPWGGILTNSCQAYTACKSQKLSVFCKVEGGSHFLPKMKGIMPGVMTFFQTVEASLVKEASLELAVDTDRPRSGNREDIHDVTFMGIHNNEASAGKSPDVSSFLNSTPRRNLFLPAIIAGSVAAALVAWHVRKKVSHVSAGGSYTALPVVPMGFPADDEVVDTL